MIKNEGYNFNRIQNIVDAAWHLQDAGLQDKCNEALKSLSDLINESQQDENKVK